MLQIVNQNAFQFLDTNTPGVFIHQANCFNTMGAGIAKEVRSRVPEAYAADRATGYGDATKLGSYSFFVVNTKPVQVIFNLYSQFNYRPFGVKHTNEEAMQLGLTRICGYLTAQQVDAPIYLPYKIGCNLGGGNWESVYALIGRVSAAFPNLNFFICKLA